MTARRGDSIRVLLICNVDWFLLSHRAHLVSHLVGTGRQVTVACADTGRVAEIRGLGADVVVVNFTRSGTSLVTEARTAMSLVRVVRRVRPDIIHNVTVKPVLYGTFAARVVSRGTPIINAVSGFGFSFSKTAGKVLKGAVLGVYRVLMRAKRVTFLVQNEDARDLLVAQRITRDGQIAVIEGSGIDCERFRPDHTRRNPATVCVLMASRILRDKGVEEFLGAARSVVANDSSVACLLAGSLDSGGNPTSISEEELSHMMEGSTVSYLGEVTDMASLMQSVDIVVLPSHHEGLPQVLLEAAASGLPLVATDIPGCRSVVEPGANGERVPVGDARALAQAIMRLASDPGLRERYGDASRTIAVARFARDKIMSDYDVLYERVLAGRAQR